MERTDAGRLEVGKVVLVLGDDISTDSIYPGRFMATVLPEETPQYAFADHAEFNARLKRKEIPPGSVIVGGSNFGCGSSREQAASALKGHGLIVVAKSFARIFLQNAVNLGLRVVTCPSILAAEGDELEIQRDSIFNRSSGESFAADPLPPARLAIMTAGGLIPYTRKRLLERRARKE
ncbi:MAG: 3-isopropylmalate dehydratase [Ignavibacteriaceae bacterium]|nr:3-isopropylmalate dehydratase [Ignavibacteriaceae bacterium]